MGRAWCAITHVPADDTYAATITCRRNGRVTTEPLATGAGAALADGAECLGFIEGSSVGHIAARSATDASNTFNGWTRQSFDKDVTSDEDGGTVWEHWVTTRDLRPSSRMGTSVLQAYLTLVARLGGRFVAAVARGRREHNHPRQLVALVKAGLLTADEAAWDVAPDPIPRAAQDSDVRGSSSRRAHCLRIAAVHRRQAALLHVSAADSPLEPGRGREAGSGHLENGARR